MQELRIRQHLELKELVQTFVESDSVKVFAALSGYRARGRETSRPVLRPPAKTPLYIVRRIAQRKRQNELRLVLILRFLARLARDAVSDHALKHVCYHRFVPLFQRLLARPEILVLVHSRLVRVDEPSFKWLIKLDRRVYVLVRPQEQA